MTGFLSRCNRFSGTPVEPQSGTLSGMAMVNPKDVARRLKAVMQDEELKTVQDLADFVGAERNAVSNWLQGYNLPPVARAMALIEKKPGLTLDWLYAGNADAVPMKLAIKLAALEAGMQVPVVDQEPEPGPVAHPRKAKAPRGAARKKAI